MGNVTVVKFLHLMVLCLNPLDHFLQHLDIVEEDGEDRLSIEGTKETVLLEYLHVAFLASKVLKAAKFKEVCLAKLTVEA